MFGFFLIIFGIGLVGVAAYNFYGSSLFAKHPRTTGISSVTDQDDSAYDVIPSPTSAKPIYVGLCLASFSLSLFLIYYLVNFSQSFAGKFWIFILILAFFWFGWFLIGLAGTADQKMAEKETRITKINTERLEQKAQAVKHAFVIAEEEKEAQLRQQQLDNKLKEQQILNSLYNQALNLGIPMQNLAGLNEEKLRAAIEVEADRQIEENRTQQDLMRDINTKKVESFGDNEKITKIQRVKYDELSTKLLREIGKLKEEIAVLKTDKQISSVVKKVRIQNMERDIENQEFQLDELRAGLVNVNRWGEGKGLNS